MDVQSQEPTAQTEAVTPTQTEQKVINEEVKNPEAVLAKNKELLGRRKSTKSELEELRNWKKEQELAEQQRNGDLEGVINALREENNTLKSNLTETKRGYATKSVEDQIKSAARAKGCVNADKLMRLLTKDQLSTVQVGDDFRVNGDDLTRLMDDLEKEHSDIGLFKKGNVNINTVTGELNKSTSGTNTDNMSSAEYMEYIRTLNL